LAAVFCYLLVRRELTRAAPLFPVDLLSIPMFGLSVGTSICSFAAQMLALVALPFHLQQEFGYTAVQTGLIITPWPLAIAGAAAQERRRKRNARDRAAPRSDDGRGAGRAPVRPHRHTRDRVCAFHRRRLCHCRGGGEFASSFPETPCAGGGETGERARLGR